MQFYADFSWSCILIHLGLLCPLVSAQYKPAKRLIPHWLRVKKSAVDVVCIFIAVLSVVVSKRIAEKCNIQLVFLFRKGTSSPYCGSSKPSSVTPLKDDFWQTHLADIQLLTFCLFVLSLSFHDLCAKHKGMPGFLAWCQTCCRYHLFLMASLNV